MKSTPSELISTFRKKISLQSFIILLLIAVTIMALFFIPVELTPFMEGATSSAFILLAFTAFLIFRRRTSYLKKLDPSQPDKSLMALELYFDEEQKTFRGTDIIRWIFGSVLTIGMLLLIYFKPHNRFTGVICAAWFGIILLSMIKSWMLMQDGMLLQDLKHCRNNHPSEIS